MKVAPAKSQPIHLQLPKLINYQTLQRDITLGIYIRLLLLYKLIPALLLIAIDNEKVYTR